MESSLEIAAENDRLGPSTVELLAMMPYGKEFCFIDEFLEADRIHVIARHRFREDAFFYSGHFSDGPVTPGVILLEAMCQSGMVAQGLYRLAQERGVEETKKFRFLLTGSEVEWLEQVRPGDTVIMRGELTGWKQGRIRTSVKMLSAAGALIADAKISGMGVLWNPGN